MIDTNRYEGHLIDKAVEDNSQVWVWKNWMLKNAETIEQHEATAALLNDAPKLLAEVKELRRQIKVAQGVFEYLYNFHGADESEDAHWIRWFCNMEDEE